MATLKLTTVGNSVGVVLPKEILERPRVRKGDSLSILETPRGIELTPYDPKFARQMDLAQSSIASAHVRQDYGWPQPRLRKVRERKGDQNY